MGSKDYFNEIASNWDEMRNEFFPDSIRAKAIKLSGIKTGLVTVDLGAGTGFMSEELLKSDNSVIAVDQSQNMLDVMNNKFGTQSKFRTVLAEATNLPLKDNSVDFVFANMYLHHLENPQLAIKETYRILKPGGKFIVTDLDEHNHDFLVTEQFDIWKGFHRDEIYFWFEKARFQKISVDCLNETCGSDSLESNERADITIFIAIGEK